MPARAELIYESGQTRVTRLVVAGRTIVRKEPLGPGADARLRHEVAILERLRGLPGVAQLMDEPRSLDSIVLEDAGHTSLAARARPFSVDEVIALAVLLTRAVAGMHGRGVLHRDIAPANVVLSADAAPCLVDFGVATSFGEIRPEFTHHSEIVGTLPYIAPEQTGRIGRPVDQRADLYALGATVYELATGTPPFGTGDPVRLIHDHLARVPAAPAEMSPAIPAALSTIIMHLLEKEPDARYQSAEGLLHDLERLQATQGRPPEAPFRIGEHDAPPRVLRPSRVVGREAEVATLEAAFERALTGQCRVVLVAGEAGIGKTALVDELRPAVTGRDGWFVAGKFDQDRRGVEFDGFFQAFNALTRLLLAEPEDELDELRERIVRALGANAGLATAASPESAALLRVPADPGDPLTAEIRAQRSGFDFLRAVASPRRPVVFFVDDLHWAGRMPFGLFDLILDEAPIDGLLLVGAYREHEVDAAHPLAQLLDPSRDRAGVEHLRLANLSGPRLAALVAETLHVDRAAATSLAEAIEAQTSGNPFETVEVLNALHHDGVLRATPSRWQWDGAAVRDRLGHSEVAELATARIGALPQTSLEMVESLACLGARAELHVVSTATGERASVAEPPLAPALDGGLLVIEPGAHEAVRFRHDRIRQIILTRVPPQRRRALQLAMARRLAAVPELSAVAAEQYLPWVDAIDDAAEQRQVVGLMRRAADQAAVVGDHALVNTLLAAALQLADPDDPSTLIELHAGRHAALFSVGRLEEADEAYRMIAGLSTTAFDRSQATYVQIRSLTQRNRYAAAIDLGLESLRELGITVPAADRVAAGLEQQFGHLYRWLERTEDVDGAGRPALSEPTLLAATRLLNAVLPAIYMRPDPETYAWLSLEAVRIWHEHGPGRTLLGPAGNAAIAAVRRREDYAAGYRALRRILALAEARGYEPEASQARFLVAHLSWCGEPLENAIPAGREARRGLVAGGDPVFAGYTYYPTFRGLLDCRPLDEAVAELEAGLAFAQRIGSAQSGEDLDIYRRMVGVLRGESATGDGLSLDRYAEAPWALLHAYIAHAFLAAIFGDVEGLAKHTAAAMPLLQGDLDNYPSAVAIVLRGLALAAQARATGEDHGGPLLAEMEELSGWVAARAADAPDNFVHLLRLLEAERLWAAGDFKGAVLGFDAARREARLRQRPWHRALIAEHAARFHLAHGMDLSGYDLLAEARSEYLAWGATAKVDQLDWAYPSLRPSSEATPAQGAARSDRHPALATGTIDLLGVLAASQALGSESSIDRLHSRVSRVLSEMTGATGVHLLLWSEDRQEWLLPASSNGVGVATGPQGRDPTVPMSVVRYAQRTREAVVVADATRDERFARDPYFADLGFCSLLALPIVGRGALRAVLLIENRLIRGAFTTERLDAVKLIAGQLAVSLDNAKVNAEYRRIAEDQAALRRVAVLAARPVASDELFATVAEEVGNVLGADFTLLGRYGSERDIECVGAWTASGPAPFLGRRLSLGDDDVSTLVFERGAPVRLDGRLAAGGQAGDTSRDFGVRVAVGAPIMVGDRLWGAVIAGATDEASLPPDTEHRLAAFSELVAMAIANAQNRAELDASRARLVTETDAARRRVVRDLHDGAQQRLIHSLLTLGLAQRSLALDDGQAPTLIAEAEGHVQRANEELRELSHGILPADLTRGGLRGAVDAVVERVDLDVKVALPDDRLPTEIEASAYFIVAEAVTNIVKHAGAGSAEVSASIHDGTLRVQVRDDGVGGADPRGQGLVGMRDRVTALGGKLEVESPAGEGTVVTATLPISRERVDGTYAG